MRREIKERLIFLATMAITSSIGIAIAVSPIVYIFSFFDEVVAIDKGESTGAMFVASLLLSAFAYLGFWILYHIAKSLITLVISTIEFVFTGCFNYRYNYEDWNIVEFIVDNFNKLVSFITNKLIKEDDIEE